MFLKDLSYDITHYGVDARKEYIPTLSAGGEPRKKFFRDFILALSRRDKGYKTRTTEP